MDSRVRHIVDALALWAMSSCPRAFRVCLCLALCCLPLLAMGQAPATADSVVCERDSARIYFQVGKSVYNPDLRGNRAVLAEYVDRIKALDSADRLIEVVVEGYVSPEGGQAINERLAVRRSRVLADIIAQRTGVDPSKIKAEAAGIDWGELRRLIDERPDVPQREALLNIIDNTPIYVFDRQGRIIGGRKKSLMDLRRGDPYRWLLANLFPEMRNATAISLSYKEEEPEPIIDIEPVDTIEEVIVEPIDTAYLPEEVIIDLSADTLGTPDEPFIDIDPLHAFALKTNLLYYPILLPNLELEWYVNDKWSVCLEGNLAWWSRHTATKETVYELLMVSPEARRWFLRGPLRRGLFVGATVGFGMYDFLRHSNGHRGEGYMAGLTCGYQWPITRALSLEANLGAGYVYINDKEYKPIESHHVYQRTRAINYFGPIKAELSIVWRFLDTNKSHKSPTGR